VSFAVDWLSLIMCGYGISWLAKRRKLYAHNGLFIRSASSAIIALFYFISVPLFFNNLNFPLAKPFLGFINSFSTFIGSRTFSSGTDFMFNFPFQVVMIPDDIPSNNNPFLLAFATAMFLLYPIFVYIGVILGRVLFGQKPDDKGFLYLLY
jgi:hypothetical protein